MNNKQTINVPLNRVEGDLEIRVDIQHGVVVDAWSSGTMYRGIENILVGRGALDGLVITPRICGICNTSHLMAAALALDMISGVQLPLDAVRVRNLSVAVEKMQSDMRHAFLMFTADFANPVYQEHPLFAEAQRRYQPFKGKTVIQTVEQTKKLLEIIAIVGGQWPHSSYMVPGGIVSVPSDADLLQCRLLLTQYRHWYERRVLGCCLERWSQIQCVADLDAWLEVQVHQESDLGFYIRFARDIGLDRIGQGHDDFISYGLPNSPLTAGFAQNVQIRQFDQALVTEHVSSSWFVDYEGGKHPFEGETRPYATGKERGKYSWAKAPRYAGLPAETGPLAEAVIAQDPLFADLLRQSGSSAFVRELARLVRAVKLIPAVETWLAQTSGDSKFYQAPREIVQGEGFGLLQATRGALGHWVRIEDSLIKHYQIITPTAWNCSPRDADGNRGPLEQALVGTPVKNADNPVELGHVVRSFDPCLVCTVHLISGLKGCMA